MTKKSTTILINIDEDENDYNKIRINKSNVYHGNRNELKN